MNKSSFPPAILRFIEHPDVSALRDVLDLGQEFDCLDFKREWGDLNGEGRAGLAKDVLSFANTGGGLIIVGVADDCARVGVSSYLDPSIFRHAIAAFLPAGDLPATLWSLECDGLRYQIILISPDDEALPYEAARSGASIERGRVYVRVGASNAEATSTQMLDLVRRRDIARAAPTPTLEEMIDGLELCYKRLDSDSAIAAATAAGDENRVHYNQFLKSLIARTERAIERRLAGHS